jgi:diguanylate cyclase (GGDEF)-like protein
MLSWIAEYTGLNRCRATFYTLYLTLISCAGVGLTLCSLLHLPADADPLLLGLFLLFATVSAVLTTSMPTPHGSGITYHIGSVIGIATVPLFGVSAAIIVVAVQGICTWFIKPAHAQTWKKSWSQLAFNIGMDSVSIGAAGLMWQWADGQLASYPFWQATVPWLLAALVYTEVNLWLLIGILFLQQGAALRPLTMWREEHWSTQIDVILMTVGGALLAYVAHRYDWLGLMIFFLPVALSAYAFRLYVQQMQAHLDNLDQIVNERTASLRDALAQLQIEVNERQRAEAELRRLATYDALTNALNRRVFLEEARHHFTEARRNGAPLAILMFDLDRFKQINDRYGHAAGDVALQYFAGLCMAIAPQPHLFGRLGGEEFALLLPQTDEAGAHAIGDAIRQRSPTTILTAGAANFTVMVSVGLAIAKATDPHVEQVLERADQRLYTAKRRGGNCVVAATML